MAADEERVVVEHLGPGRLVIGVVQADQEISQEGDQPAARVGHFLGRSRRVRGPRRCSYPSRPGCAHRQNARTSTRFFRRWKRSAWAFQTRAAPRRAGPAFRPGLFPGPPGEGHPPGRAGCRAKPGAALPGPSACDWRFLPRIWARCGLVGLGPATNSMIAS